jgi:hypothetical protein
MLFNAEQQPSTGNLTSYRWADTQAYPDRIVEIKGVSSNHVLQLRNRGTLNIHSCNHTGETGAKTPKTLFGKRRFDQTDLKI